MILFLVAGLLNVSVLWLEVAIASKKFKIIANPQISKNYQKGIIIFDIIFVVLATIINWLNTSFIGIVGAVLIIIICIVYLYSAYLITVLVESHEREQTKKLELTDNSKQTKKLDITDNPKQTKKFDIIDNSKQKQSIKITLLRVRKTALLVVLFLMIWLLSLIIFSIGYPTITKKYHPYGSVIYYFIIADFGIFFSIASIMVVTFFVTYRKSKGTIDKTTSNDNNDNNNNTNNNEYQNERNTKSFDAKLSGITATPYSSNIITPQFD